MTPISHQCDTPASDGSVSEVELNQLVEQMRPLLGRIAGAFVRVDVTLEPTRLRVHAERDLLEQALLSLVVSASDAMPLGGRLSLSTRRWHLGTPHVHQHGTVPAGEWAVLRVSDTGARLEEHAVDRLFGKSPRPLPLQPAGSTDLSKVATAVRRASGHVLLEQRGDAGTAIAICFPASPRQPLARKDPGVTPAILVVDGDSWLRTTTTHVLRRAGYGVLETDRAAGALELLDGVTGSCIRVMLVDVDLPGGEAEELVRTAYRKVGDLHVVFLGHSRAGWSEDLLTKPFTAEELLAAVARRLESPVPG